jgi:cell division septal protein FtsQ
LTGIFGLVKPIFLILLTFCHVDNIMMLASMIMPRPQAKKYFNPFKKLQRKSFHLFFILLFCFIIGASFYCLLFSNFWQIKIIRINGDYPIEPNWIHKVISEFLNQNSFISQRHFLFFNKLALAKTIEEKYPVEKVELKTNFKNRSIDIYLQGKLFIGYWLSRGLVFRIDRNGQIIDFVGEMNERQLEKMWRIYDLDNGLPSINEVVIDKTVIDFIDYFNRSSISQWCKPRFWEVSKKTKTLNLVTDDNLKIYFVYYNNLENQLKTLEQVLNQVIKPEEKNKIEYIDLRFGERVYYKMR